MTEKLHYGILFWFVVPWLLLRCIDHFYFFWKFPINTFCKVVCWVLCPILIDNKISLNECYCFLWSIYQYSRCCGVPTRVFISEMKTWTSLMVQWLRIYLPMQGTQVRSLVLEDSSCCGTKKSMSCNYWAHTPQQLKPSHARDCAPQQEKPLQWNPHTTTRENPRAATNTQHSQEKKTCPFSHRLLRVPWDCKEINPEYQWKDWCWSWRPILWLRDAKSWLIRKDTDSGKIEWRRIKGR